MAADKNEDFMKNMRKLFSGNEMEEQLLKRRQIFLWGEIMMSLLKQSLSGYFI